MKDIETVATPWREVVLVCGKCGKKLDGGFGKKRRDKLRSVLKMALKEAGRRRSVRVAETGCLGLCPKNAVSLLRAGHPETLYAVPAGTAMSEVLVRLDLAAAKKAD